MVDRRAIVIGSWQAPGREKPTPQRVMSMTGRWKKIFSGGKYDFRSTKDKTSSPAILHNPTDAEILAQITGARHVTSESELLIYFLGHSVSRGESDLMLILGEDEDGQERRMAVSWLLSTLNQTPFTKFVIILDACHSGRARDLFATLQHEWFAMFATGSEYAFDAKFSDSLLKALETDVTRNDHRIDRKQSGITYRKVFEEARGRLISSSSPEKTPQQPECYGVYGSTVLLPAAPFVSEGYNKFASDRTIYGRLRRIMQLIRDGDGTFAGLDASVKADAVFVLTRNSTGQARTISKDRLGAYLAFLRKAGWAVQPSGAVNLTSEGLAALDDATFNKQLLEVIEIKIFPTAVGYSELDEVVKDLLEDLIPPTPANIHDRFARRRGTIFPLDEATRMAIQLLPSTGKFGKGAADAIFPPDL